MKPITLDELKHVLQERFGGVLHVGKHSRPSGQACALEFLSQVQETEWSDDPYMVRTWDLRSLNDIQVNDAVRAECLLPVIALYAGSMDWPMERQKTVAEKLVILTTNRLIADLPGLPEAIRMSCRDAGTIDQVKAAVAWAAVARAEAVVAWVVWGRAAGVGAWAAWVAARAARAAWAAWMAEAAWRPGGVAAEERVFRTACQVWVDAASEGR